MLTALIIVGSLLGYLTIGRTVADASWRTWTKGDPKTTSARFLFPYESRLYPKKFGKLDRYGLIAARTDPLDSIDVMLYHWGTTAFWSVKLLWCSFACLGIGVGKGVNWLTAWPSQLLLPPADRKALPEPEAARPESTPPERRYLDADRRERELHAKMDATRLEKQEAAKALGGEDQARKLAALPDRKL
ncbi:MAG: hypothetical protein AAB554_03015 [Patescibacteria group bacterium]